MDFLEAILAAMMPVFLAGAGWLAFQAERRIKALTHVEMESYHREALHKALQTGVLMAVARMLRDGVSVEGHVMDLKRQAVDYAQKSVPDAIGYLGASFERLLDLAEAKIEENAPIFPTETSGQMNLDL